MDTQTTAPHTSADRAGAVKQEATTAASEVASTAGQEAKRVTADATHQLRGLMGQTRHDLQEQAASQQARAASGLRELADQLREMADGSDSEGMARDLVDDVARRAGDAASWLDARDPGSLLDEARQFARRRPGAFLAIAAGVGVVAGRLSRSLIDEARDESEHVSAQDLSMDGATTRNTAMGNTGTPSVHPGATPMTSDAGTGAGGVTAGTAAGMAGTSGIPASDIGRTAGSGATTTGTPSVPPTPGGSPMAPQADATHTGTGGLTTEDDDNVVRGER
jgi:hypothetical protein